MIGEVASKGWRVTIDGVRAPAGIANLVSLATIVPALQEIVEKLRGVSSELSQIEVELGLKLTGEAGMVIARAGAEANFRVLVRWERPSRGESQ